MKNIKKYILMSNLILFNILIYHILKKYAKIDVSLIELYG